MFPVHSCSHGPVPVGARPGEDLPPAAAAPRLSPEGLSLRHAALSEPRASGDSDGTARRPGQTSLRSVRSKVSVRNSVRSPAGGGNLSLSCCNPLTPPEGGSVQ